MIEVRAPRNEKEWEDYYDLRYRILREPLGKKRGSEKNDGDKSGLHICIYDDGALKAIARLDKTDQENVGQVRFVAVENAQQGKGYGRMIMEAVEEISEDRGDTKMILHARDYAVDFYLKLDYRVIEKSHLLFGILQHFLMERTY
jgi:predicted GNAT family N-acyltransferase